MGRAGNTTRQGITTTLNFTKVTPALLSTSFSETALCVDVFEGRTFRTSCAAQQFVKSRPSNHEGPSPNLAQLRWRPDGGRGGPEVPGGARDAWGTLELHGSGERVHS